MGLVDNFRVGVTHLHGELASTLLDSITQHLADDALVSREDPVHALLSSSPVVRHLVRNIFANTVSTAAQYGVNSCQIQCQQLPKKVLYTSMPY